MPAKPGHPTDDPSKAPESGTERDETSGNQPSDRAGALAPDPGKKIKKEPDDPSEAAEER